MRVMTFVISALLSVVLGAVAGAHAFLDHAEPRVGSTVPTAPRQLSFLLLKIWSRRSAQSKLATLTARESI